MTTADYGFIQVRGARENNLKDISLDIPKRKITLFTGVSGSGKSSLVFDTIAAESQRLINETYTAFLQSLLPGYGQPDVDSLENLSAAIIVDQKRLGGNSRSTVGTVTDAYSMLRLIFARLGAPAVANPGVLSFNDPNGMCPDCEGLGDVAAIDEDAIVDRDKSLNEGAIRLSGFNVDSWFWAIITQSGFFDNDKKLRDYTADEWHQLMYLPEAKVKLNTPAGSMNSTYEGLVPKFKRLYLTKQTETTAAHIRAAIDRIATRSACTTCGGARLNAAALACRIDGRNIADCAAMEVADLAGFIRGIDAPTLAPMLNSLAARLDNLTHIGLGYLSLNRPSATLSGGESQRVKMVRHLGSSLTDMTYVFDEPSVGLHPHDVHRLNELLVRLRDKGNTVLVVEHRPSVIAIADHVVDMGPRAGRDGGQVVYAGDLAGLAASGTLTGEHLSRHQALKPKVRAATGELVIKDAALHNLKGVTASIPQGVLTVVTGVAGSGKSSLIQGCLPRHHPDAIFIDQRPIRGSKRSTPATYTGVLDPIRKAFAKANGVNAALFSANSKGACPQCQGIGLLYTDLAFMDPVVSTCEACDGRRFLPEVLEHKLRGQNISEILRMQITEAASFFTEKAIKPMVTALVDVGLGYLTLGQSLDTLSGGERQRLKLATELGNSSRIYVLDEPTTGLHMNDVDNLIGLLDRLVDGGSTVIVIEHNLDVISRADWIIDMGPGAGHDGGRVVFAGTPHDLLADERSLTAAHLRTHLG
ncbi:ATP-binding cassette domain-containing protein [Catellatospora sichuanensis]|uniref:ATP-binding cassette domain-containing protein n=1 Tax=Catellatospora sichuanensis TaxID=1969805 RepID=UPI0011827A3A|nr:excinuclease ABC subunit UvrA [Catellatospora sichuanensis]